MKDGWVEKHRWKLDEWKLCTKDIEMIDESRWMKKLEKKTDEQMMKDEWESWAVLEWMKWMGEWNENCWKLVDENYTNDWSKVNKWKLLTRDNE